MSKNIPISDSAVDISQPTKFFAPFIGKSRRGLFWQAWGAIKRGGENHKLEKALGSAFSDADEAAVLALVAFLDARRRPAFDVQNKSFKGFFATVFDTARSLRTNFGEAGLWRGTAIRTNDESEFRAYWKSISNDLHRHIELVREGIEALHDVGLLPPPGSVRRLAILLRRAGRVDLEAKVLRAWIDATPRGNSRAYEALVLRANRAEELAGRSASGS